MNAVVNNIGTKERLKVQRSDKLLSTILLILSLATTAFCGPVVAGIAVVVNHGNPINILTAEEVKDIFLKKVTTFPDGAPATPVYQDEDSKIYGHFAERVLEKDTAHLKSYWSGQIFSGKNTLPEVVKGDEAVKQHVSGVPEAIGYIDSRHVDKSVKVVFTIE